MRDFASVAADKIKRYLLENYTSGSSFAVYLENGIAAIIRDALCGSEPFPEISTGLLEIQRHVQNRCNCELTMECLRKQQAILGIVHTREQLIKDVVRASKCFAFEVSDFEDDSVIGRIRSVNIHAGEVRRLNQALERIVTG